MSETKMFRPESKTKDYDGFVALGMIYVTEDKTLTLSSPTDLSGAVDTTNRYTTDDLTKKE